MFYGLLNLPWWGYIVVVLFLTHLTILGVTIFLHRCQAHRALILHPIPSHFFRFWLWLTTGMETKAWAAVHRKHHAKCEKEDDPHSPQVLGLSKVLFEGAELYRREAKNAETLKRYGDGTPDDWLERNVYTRFSKSGIFLMLAINLILFGVPGLTIWALQMGWIPFYAAGVINGVGHFWGYRNFDCEDASTNISPWGIIIGGEELHNNHHAYPTSAKFSIKWWEFDLGWFYIKLLSFLGLARVKRVVPQPKIVPGKKQIDGEGLSALLSNRIQVMTWYSKAVVVPFFKQEQQAARSVADRDFLQRMRKIFVSGETVCDEKVKQSLEQFLQKGHGLAVVYTLREQLHSIWEKTTATQKELLDALHEWCHQAEQTGIQRLQDFVAYLRGYTLVQPVI